MKGAELEAGIRKYAEKYLLPFDLCSCLVFQESKGIFWASRFEEKWFAAKLLLLPASKLAGYVPRSGTPSLYDEKVWRAHSWGLGQLMGDRARILGFRGDYLPQLIADPELNLDLSFRYLRQCLDRATPSGARGVYRPGELFSAVPVNSPDFVRVCRGLLGYNGGGNPEYPNDVLRWMPGEKFRQMFA